MLAAAARQRVSRRSPAVRSLTNLAFPRNARFLYLPEQYGSSAFWSTLVKALYASKGSYARALAALQQRGGIMPVDHFSIAAGAPLEQTRQLAADTIRARLVEAKLLEELDVPGVGTCVAFARGAEYLEQPAARMKARLITEAILLSALKSWARELGLGSYEKFEVRDEGTRQPRVSTFEWDITAPSYLGGLANWAADAKPKPGFVVFDVFLGGVLTEAGLEPFIHKCLTLRSLKKVGRCIQFFVAERYTPEALRLARKHGVVPATPASLFGDELAAALTELIATMTNAAQATIDPEKFTTFFTKLGKIEGAVSRLRGALFEFVVADIVRKKFHARVKLNDIYRQNGKDVAEIDVRGVVDEQCVYFIECKGYMPGRLVDDDEIEKWLTKRIPLVRQRALEHPEWRNLKLRFELWTTGELSESAKARIAEAQRSIRATAYVVEVRQAKQIEQLARETNDVSLIGVLQQHFLKSPLADVDKKSGGVDTNPMTHALPFDANSIALTTHTVPFLLGSSAG
ncbi:nuclease-related domain-containing protein [Caballeronia sordidicola]|uniref:nuclease-related domain-containing protein n=1 Tax=Caballeronia sordidicola TaxID=196367 RepID=UPI00068CE895|nr:NERD domain-containing protein [Caballeronia sordidicola]